MFAEDVVQVLDARTGTPRFATRYTAGALSGRVVFSPNGALVAASGAHSLLVLDAVTGAVKWSREFEMFVVPPSFSSDGILLLAGFTRAASMFLAETGGQLWERPVDELKVLAFHPGGRIFAEACLDASGRGNVSFADASIGRPELSRPVPERLRALAYNGDGGMIAFGGFSGLAGLLDSRTGEMRGLFAHAAGAPDVFQLACSPDSKLVATRDTNSVTRVYDAGTFALLRTIANIGDLTTPDVLEFSPDSKSLLVNKGRHRVRAIDIATGAELYVLEHNNPDPMGPFMDSAAFSRDGKRVATTGGDKVVKVFDPFGTDVVELAHDGAVRTLAFAPDAHAVSTGSADSSARVFAATGEERARLNHGGPVCSVAWIPTGSLVVSGSADRMVRVFDSTDATERFRLAHQGTVVAVAASVDGRKVASGSEDGRARLIDLEVGTQQSSVSHDGPVVAVVFSGDKKWLGTASLDGTARLINATSGTEHLRLNLDGPVRAVAFSADGRWFAAGGDDRTARLFEIENGGERCKVVHGGAVLSLAFHPNSAVVAAGCADGMARTFAAPGGQPLATLSHAGAVRMVAFSASGLVATAGDDRTARVFVADSGAEQVRHEHPGLVAAVAFSPDGGRLATACADGVARIFEV
ncbi:PQQ-binding-like beta-propeller repeat protein [Amycolatopsis sp. H6(2020)]|nr:PQQ-binding-like beta-propeller repeat protein [Amycolatopsis sp. H6(2020)]